MHHDVAAVGQDTAIRLFFPSISLGCDQLDPLKMSALPSASTAAQKLELAHDTL